MASGTASQPLSTDAKPTPSQPIPPTRLNEIANDACNTTFQFVDSYDHSRTSAWNTNIINTILQALISETTAAHGAPTYKFAVTSTIIQHTTPPRSHPVNSEHASMEWGPTGADNVIGRRGMHSATGAFWNNERDGMWSYKYEGGESKGFDIVVSVVWIGIV